MTYTESRNILYAATDVGVFFLEIDDIAPVAKKIIINNNDEFATKHEVHLELNVIGLTQSIDSMIISEEILFEDADWQPFFESLQYQLSDDAPFHVN